MLREDGKSKIVKNLTSSILMKRRRHPVNLKMKKKNHQSNQSSIRNTSFSTGTNNTQKLKFQKKLKMTLITIGA